MDDVETLDAENPHADIDVDTSAIEAWYFVPYTDAPQYSPDDPLYSLVGVFDGFGVVMVYDRPGDAGAFHTVDPGEIEGDKYPPSEAFQTGLSVLLSNPGEEKDITQFVEEMFPWEHHQLEVLITGLNESPEVLPDEVTEFINAMLEEQLTYKIDEDADSTHFGKIVSEEGEHFLQELL